MLELGRYPACVLPCHTTLTEDRSMSDRKYSGSSRDHAVKTERRERSKPMRDHRHGRSSAEDPTISSTRSGKSVPSNARNHPRAELKDSDTPRQTEAGSSGGRQSQGSPAVNHVSSSKSNGGRKRVCEEEEEEEGSVWVEHTSSSGRIYYYNKKNGVSQWERPASMAKRTKIDDRLTKSTLSLSSSCSKHSSHSHNSPSQSHSQHTPSSSHSHPQGGGSHRGHSSSSHHSSHSSHHSSHHTSHSSHSSHPKSHPSQSHHDRLRERDRGHGSHRRSNRGSRSSSKSASVSPTSSGRARGNHHHDKTTPNRHSTSSFSSRSHHTAGGGTKRGSVSPSVVATSSKQTSVSAVAVSPCTPSIPHGISQSLVATQHVINQTSAIIKHQQKLLSASGDPVTPTTISPPPSSSSKHPPTSSSSLPHPHARQKLVFQPSGVQQANGPLPREVGSTPVNIATLATPLQNRNSPLDMSPQMMGLENLHPLQRALLLQQQQQQQECMSEIPARRSTPGTPLPSGGGGGGATPISQTAIQAVSTPPISALPPHLTSQVSHPGSPYSNSPNHTPSFSTPPPGVHLIHHPMVPGPFSPVGLPPSNPQTPVYHYSVPMVMPGPNTPIHGIYMTEGGMVQAAAVGVAPGVRGGGYVTPAVPLRPPMSRLSRRRSSGTDEFATYPDPGQVETVGSNTHPETFSRSLAESWWSPAIETLQRQLDNSLREVLSRRTTEALCLHGRLRRSQLSLDSTRLRTNTRRERLLALEGLVTEINQR